MKEYINALVEESDKMTLGLMQIDEQGFSHWKHSG